MRKQYMNKEIYLIPLISFILFLFETVYTRLLSAILYNSYVYLIISLAIIGYGIGCYLYNNISRKKKWKLSKSITCVSTVLLSFMMLVLVYFLPFSGFWVYLIPVSIPFILAGFIYTQFYNEYSSRTGFIYALDLTGAVLGLVAGYVFINMIGLVEVILLIGVVVFFIPVFLFFKKEKTLSLLSLALTLFLVFTLFNNNLMSWIHNNFNSYYTSDVTTMARLKNSGSEFKVLESKWDIFSRTDILEIEDNTRERIVTIDGAANASIVHSNPKTNSHHFLMGKIDFIPYILREPDHVAIIGAGGGRDVKQALLGRAKNVDAVEINRSSVELTNKMAEYSGDIYGDKRVNVIVDDGRSFIEKSQKEYDVIFLSMVMTGASQAEGLITAEAFIYTKEAVNSYMKKLSSDGLLTFVTHDIQDMSKTIRTIGEVLLEQGVPKDDISEHILVAAASNQHGEEVILHQPVIIYSPAKFTDSEKSRLYYFLNRLEALAIITGLETDNEMFLSLLKGEDINLPFDYTPATDDKPYFYKFQKGLPDNVFMILLVSIASAFLLWSHKIGKRKILGNSIYFSLSGMGFMLVEIALIQKMSLILGHPGIAFLFVLITVLTGAGIGGIYSQKKGQKAGKYAGLCAGIIILLSAISLILLKEWIMNKDLIVRILILGPVIFTASFFQGILFPEALRKMKNNVSVYYGINSNFSLIGSVLAMVLMILFGNFIALTVGALIYLILFFIRPVTIGR